MFRTVHVNQSQYIRQVNVIPMWILLFVNSLSYLHVDLVLSDISCVWSDHRAEAHTNMYSVWLIGLHSHMHTFVHTFTYIYKSDVPLKVPMDGLKASHALEKADLNL